jgi:hypothetical protein
MGGYVLINTTQPAWPVARSSLRLCNCGLIHAYYLNVSFSLAWSCAVVDKKEHTTGAIEEQILRNLKGGERQEVVFCVYCREKSKFLSAE